MLLVRQSDGIVIDSNNDVSPVLQIITWFLLCVNILAVLARTRGRLFDVKNWKLDDACILSALIISVGQSIATSIQNSRGYGRRLSTLSAHEFVEAEKANYAADLLFVLSMCFSKLSVNAFLYTLTPGSTGKSIVVGCGGFIGLWSVVSLFVVAFQCGGIDPWDYIHRYCIDRNAFWTSYGAINIATDVALVVLPAVVIMRLHTTLRRRLTVCLFFSFRLCAVAAIVCQIVYSYTTGVEKDPAFDPWAGILCRQVVVSASLITACMPYFKKVLFALQSGMFHVDDLRRRGQEGMYGYTGKSNISVRDGSISKDSSRLVNRSETGSTRNGSHGPGSRGIEMQTDISVVGEPRNSSFA